MGNTCAFHHFDVDLVKYLLKPPPGLHAPRNAVAIAVLVIYSLLLLMIGLTYFRLLYTVTFNPGYVPKIPQHRTKHRRGSRARDSRESDTGFASNQGVAEKAVGKVGLEPAPSLQGFYSKDAFVCQGDGRPIWCSTCNNYKPDRAHHCREIERCVKKMDHFCPWYVFGRHASRSFRED